MSKKETIETYTTLLNIRTKLEREQMNSDVHHLSCVMQHLLELKGLDEADVKAPPTKGPAHPTNCLCGFVGNTHNIRAHRQQCETWQSQFGWGDKK